MGLNEESNAEIKVRKMVKGLPKSLEFYAGVENNQLNFKYCSY
jgi:hypothetical protein